MCSRSVIVRSTRASPAASAMSRERGDLVLIGEDETVGEFVDVEVGDLDAREIHALELVHGVR
jgi:hypothetical protein